jgi:hypothetical protein
LRSLDGGRLGRTGHQPLDSVNLVFGKTGENAGLDIKPPSLDLLEQILRLQSQLFRQHVDTGGQRRLLLEWLAAEVGRA